MASTDPVGSRIHGVLRDIAARDAAIHAFCDLRTTAAPADAASLDALPPSQRMALHGVPVAIKEVFDVAGCRCGWGTPIHADRTPAADCEAVARLKAAGAVVIGTTASTEYAMARAAPTGNPYALEHTPGASSSGSAAAVAARFVDLALGSQTIGSGIRPAAYCGVLGLKPTHGSIPLTGAMALSAPLDHAVILARSLELVGTALSVLSGRTPDAGTAEVPDAPRVVLVEPWFDDSVAPRPWGLVQAAADHLAGGKAERARVPAAVAQTEQDCLETMLAADMWRHHAGDERAAGDRMSPALRAWLARGRLVDERAYADRLTQRQTIGQAMSAAFAGVDVLATLATTDVAPLRSQGTGSRAPQRLWTLLGWPALAVPLGLVDGLPVAVQLIARPHAERTLLSAARRLASALTMPPPPGVPATSVA